MTESLLDKPMKLDLNDPSAYLPDDAVVLNLEGDAFAGMSPMVDGEHVCSVELGKRGFTTGTTGAGQNYIMAHVAATIVDPGDKDVKKMAFDNVSTLVQESSGTSTMAGLLSALGVQVAARTTLKELALLLNTALEGKPQVKVTTRWEAQYKTGEKKANGKDEYKRLARGMRSFPEDGNGGHRAEVKAPNGELVNAQAVVTRYSKV